MHEEIRPLLVKANSIADLAQIGINLKVVGNIWSNLTTQASKPDTTPDLWVHWVSTYFVDPENWVGQMYDSQFHGTWKASAYYKNPEVDALLRKARAEVKQEVRAPSQACHTAVPRASSFTRKLGRFISRTSQAQREERILGRISTTVPPSPGSEARAWTGTRARKDSSGKGFMLDRFQTEKLNHEDGKTTRRNSSFVVFLSSW